MEERKRTTATKDHWIAVVLKHSKACQGKLTLSVISAVIGVFGSILPYYGVYRIVALIVAGRPAMAQMLPWVGLCLGGYGLNVLFHSTSTVLSHQSAYTILNSIRLQMTERLMKAPLGVVLNKKIGHMKNTIVDRVEVIELPIAHMIPEGLSNTLLAIAIFLYLMTVDYRMALAAFVTAPIAFTIIGVTLRGYTEKYNASMRASDEVNNVVVTYSEGIEVIKMFNHGEDAYEHYETGVVSFRDYILAWYKSVMLPLNFAMALLPTTLLGVVPVGILLYQSGALMPAEVVLCCLLAMGIVPPLMTVSQFVNDTKMLQYAVDEAWAFLNIARLPERHEPVVLEHFGICFEGVSFAYDGENEVIHDINLTMEDGAFTALIGPSGSGKSTLCHLIARFYDVKSGAITVGGHNVKEMTCDSLLAHISMVFQKVYLFNDSILNNIRFGNPEASEEAVIAAAKKARCHEFISALPEGYNTHVGDTGATLSGGEKQRIAIARAILKDAPIVILDEATASIDPENERLIQAAIASLTQGKTVITIAHKLSTIRHADNILVIKDGEITEQGNHEALMERDGTYRHFIAIRKAAESWVI